VGSESGNEPAKKLGIWALVALVIVVALIAIFASRVTRSHPEGPGAQQTQGKG
jgi:hypothetical protein